MTRQFEREDQSRARYRTTRVARRLRGGHGARARPAGRRRLGRHRARAVRPRGVQQRAPAEPRHRPRRFPGPRARRRTGRGPGHPGRRWPGLAGGGPRRRRPRGGRQQSRSVGRPCPLPLRRRPGRHRRRGSRHGSPPAGRRHLAADQHRYRRRTPGRGAGHRPADRGGHLRQRRRARLRAGDRGLRGRHLVRRGPGPGRPRSGARGGRARAPFPRPPRLPRAPAAAPPEHLLGVARDPRSRRGAGDRHDGRAAHDGHDQIDGRDRARRVRPERQTPRAALPTTPPPVRRLGRPPSRGRWAEDGPPDPFRRPRRDGGPRAERLRCRRPPRRPAAATCRRSQRRAADGPARPRHPQPRLHRRLAGRQRHRRAGRPRHRSPQHRLRRPGTHRCRRARPARRGAARPRGRLVGIVPVPAGAAGPVPGFRLAAGDGRPDRAVGGQPPGAAPADLAGRPDAVPHLRLGQHAAQLHRATVRPAPAGVQARSPTAPASRSPPRRW